MSASADNGCNKLPKLSASHLCIHIILVFHDGVKQPLVFIHVVFNRLAEWSRKHAFHRKAANLVTTCHIGVEQ